MRRFVHRVFSFLHPSRSEAELTREIAAHLALLEDAFRRQGMSADEARLAARRAFGGVDQAKALHRDARSFVWLDHAHRDVRQAFRTLRRTHSSGALHARGVARHRRLVGPGAGVGHVPQRQDRVAAGDRVVWLQHAFRAAVAGCPHGSRDCGRDGPRRWSRIAHSQPDHRVRSGARISNRTCADASGPAAWRTLS
jgi:hypothetical protein